MTIIKGMINIPSVTGDIVITASATKIPTEQPAVTYGGIILNKTSLNIDEGSSSTFTVKLDKSPTQNQIINISVNNGNVTVNKTSLTFTPSNYSIEQTVTVNGISNSNSYSNESSVITISSYNVSSKTISVTIKNIDVQEPVDPGDGESTEITSFSLYPATKKVYVGAMGYLLPKIEPVSACGELDKIEWSVSDPSAVLLESSGKISVIREGTFTVTAKIGKHTATCKIVTDGVNVVPCTKLNINPTTISAKAGTKHFIDVTYEPENSTDFVTFSSSDLVSCDVSPYGLVTTKGPWSYANITVSCGDDENTQICAVEVLDEDESLLAGKCQDIQVDPTSVVLNKTGDTHQLTITTTPTDTTDAIKITTTDASVAKVNLSGLITAVSKGECTITANCGGCFASCDVVVEETVAQEDPYKDYNKNPQYQAAIYTNPTITIEDHLIKLEQDGYVEYFNPFQEEPHDVDFKEIKDGDTTYYLTLKDQSYSKFSVDGKRPVFYGYYEEMDSLGNTYEFNPNAVPVRQASWNVELMLKDETLTQECFNDMLEYFNSQIPALNYHQVENSMSFVEYKEYPNETYLGMALTYGPYFEVYLNKTLLEEYEILPGQFLSTASHELGHTLGLRDYPAYYPSLFDYNRDRENVTTLQPNDVYALKCFYKAHGIDLVTPLEESLKIIIPVEAVDITSSVNETEGIAVASSFVNDEPIIFMDYPYYKDPSDAADVIVECSLEFVRQESLKTNNTTFIPYKIYKIVNENVVKGALKITEIKIPDPNNITIDENCSYKLYLKECPTTPYSLISPIQGIELL